MKKRKEQIEQDVSIQKLDDRLKAVEERLEQYKECENCGNLVRTTGLFNVGGRLKHRFMWSEWVDVKFCGNCAENPDAILKATDSRLPDPLRCYPEAIKKAINKADTERDKQEEKEEKEREQ